MKDSYHELMRELQEQSRDHFARMNATTVRPQVPSEAHTLTVRGSNPRAATTSGVRMFPSASRAIRNAYFTADLGDGWTHQKRNG